LTEGDHTVQVTADGYGVAQKTESVTADGSDTIVLSALEAAPAMAAPTPTIADDAAFTLYSGTLTVDRAPSNFAEPWWMAPSFSELQIAGNSTIQYQIVAGGEAGGVAGISYGNPGVDGSYVDGSGFSALKMDAYLTAGISQIQVQVVSSGGTYTFNQQAPTTGEWTVLDIDLSAVGEAFTASELQQIGIQLWGTTSDSMYIDNLHFY
jgi:hypothetical protein